MSDISMKALLEAGVHFGHRTQRWNPKMAQFIFGERGGIYIIDLQKTLRLLKGASAFLKTTARNGGKILFVGTKKQARDIIAEQAKRCGQYWINSRWLGGTLTNYQTICRSIERLRQLQEMEEKGIFDQLPKKEVLERRREMAKLLKNLEGIQTLGDQLPSALVVVDTRTERIAIAEAVKLKIPIVAVVDTNCDPDVVNHPVPGNDDAIRAIRLLVSAFADAVIEGQAVTTEGAHDERIAAAEPAEKPTPEAVETTPEAVEVTPEAAEEAVAPEEEIAPERSAETLAIPEVQPEA